MNPTLKLVVCLMAWTISLLASETHIADVIYNPANGRVATGQVTITPSQPLRMSNGAYVTQQPATMSFKNGVFAVDLPPNDTTPGSYYKVLYQLADGTSYNETWFVPTSVNALKIGNIVVAQAGPVVGFLQEDASGHVSAGTLYNQQIQVNGVSLTKRPKLNLVQGPNTLLSTADSVDTTTVTIQSLGGGGSGGGGGINAITLQVPSWLAVQGSPLTTNGTLAITPAANLSANLFLATPAGAVGPVGPRTIVAGDLPTTISSNTTGTAADVTGVVGIIHGGTGSTTPASALAALGGVNSTQAAAAAPVQSVNGQTGAVTFTIPSTTGALTNDAGFVTAPQAAAAAPVQSVNGQTGVVTVPLYSLPVATATVLGGVKQGSNTAIAADGKITVPAGSFDAAGAAAAITLSGLGGVTSAQAAAAAPVQSFNTRTGAITPVVGDYSAFYDAIGAASAAQAAAQTYASNASNLTSGTVASARLSPINLASTLNGGVTGLLPYASLSGAPVIPATTSQLTNNSGFITAAGAPVQSVNGNTGAVTIPPYSLPVATTTVLGGVKQGSNTAIAADGTITVPAGSFDPSGAAAAITLSGLGGVTSAQAAAAAPVQSFNSRTGAIVPQASDYSSFYDPAGAAAGITLSGLGGVTAAQAKAAAPIQSINGGTGTAGAVTTEVPLTFNGGLTRTANNVALTSPIPTAVSSLTNDAGYVTATTAPVRSVAGKTGVVALAGTDIGNGDVDNAHLSTIKNVTSDVQTQINTNSTAIAGKLQSPGSTGVVQTTGTGNATSVLPLNAANGLAQLDGGGFLPYPVIPVAEAKSLLKFRAKLSAGSPATIVFLGDSITQGGGATSNSTAWANQSITKLVSKYGGTQNNALQNRETSGSGTYVGTWTGVPGVGPSQTGTVFNEVYAASSSATATFTGTGADTVDIYYYTNTDSAAFSVSIDSVGKGSFGGTVTGSYTPGVVTLTGLDPSVNHSVVITAPASGNMYLLGAVFHAGTGGVIGMNFARSGASIMSIQQTQNINFLSVIPNLSLIVCAMGANDGAVSGPTYSAKYASLIAQAQSLNVPILFVITEQTSTILASDKAAIDNTIKSMAAANGYDWLSVYDRWGSYATANAVGLYADATHPSQAGHNDISEMFCKYMMSYTGAYDTAGSPTPYTYAASGATINLGSNSVNSALHLVGGAASGQGIAISNTKTGGGGSMTVLGDGSLRIASTNSNYSIGNYDFVHGGNGNLGIGAGGGPAYPLDIGLQTRFQAGLVATGTAKVDFTAPPTSPLQTGLNSAKPATCTVGQMFYQTDATAGQNIYGCTATNVWTLQSPTLAGLGGVTSAQAAAAAPVQSVNGATGAVTIPLYNQAIQVGGVAQTQRSNLAVVGAGGTSVSATDNGTNTTTLTISSANAGSGVTAFSPVAHQFLNQVNSSGVFQSAQPAAADVTGLSASATTDTTNAGNISAGTMLAARMPAFTGDVTTTAGSVATTVKGLNGTSLAGLATGLLKNTTTTGAPSIAVAGTDYQAPLGFTAENAANKGSASGYAPLNASSLVPLLNLPTIPASQTSGFATVATSGSYPDLINKPAIPTAVSQLTNDSGYVTDSGATIVHKNAATSYTAGNKQTFQSSATTAGLGNNSVTADPSTPAAGDLWFRSDLKHLRLYDGTALQSLMTQADVLGAAQFPALTGDVTTTAGSLTATLPNIVTAGTNPKITYNAKGQVTAGAALASGDIPNNAANTTGTAANVTGTVAIANGGTGATSASAALAALGGIPDPGSGGLTARTAANTLTSRSLQPTSGGSIAWTNGDGVAGNPTPTFILPSKQYFRAAICQGSNAYPGFSTPASNAPTATCATGTNTTFGELDFATGQSIQDHFKLPADWTGALDIEFIYRNTGTTGNTVWATSTACVADGATEDPAFNTAQTVATSAQGTTLQQKTSAITGLTTTGCSANSEFHFKVALDASTTAAGAELIGLRLTVRRAL